MTTEGRLVVAGHGCAVDLSVLTALWPAAFEKRTFDYCLAPDWTMIAARTSDLFECLRMIGAIDARGKLQSFAAYVEWRERQYSMNVLVRELPGNRLVAYHNELPGDAVGDILMALVKNDTGNCDVLCIPSVVRGGPTDANVSAFTANHGLRVIRVPGYRSPYIQLNGTWEDYLASKSSNFRYSLNRKRKALAKAGKVNHVRYERAEQVAELLNLIGQIEASSWKAGAHMAITSSGFEQAYHRDLLPWLATSGMLAANVVFVNGQPVAYSLCCHWGRRLAQLKTSFDERYSSASPGLVVNAEAIRYAFELGALEFDFLGDIMPHKANWTSKVREHDHLYIYTRTAKGRLLGLAKAFAHKMRPKSAPLTIGRSGRIATGGSDEP